MIKADGPYTACHTSRDVEPFLYGVDGPGNGLGYYVWLGYPQNTFTTMGAAEQCARMMNIAFRAGLEARSRQIRELLE